MSEVINGVPRELLERVCARPWSYSENHKLAMMELSALLSEQPQASAAQSAPAGEREASLAHIANRLQALCDSSLRGKAAAEVREVWRDLSGMLASWQRAQSAPKPQRKTWRAGNPSYLCHHCGTPLMQHEQQVFCPTGPAFASSSSAPTQPAAHDQGEVQRLREALSTAERKLAVAAQFAPKIVRCICGEYHADGYVCRCGDDDSASTGQEV